jgi:hypothetical protein
VLHRNPVSAVRILTDAFADSGELPRKLQMFAVFEFFFALLTVFLFGAFPF